MNREIFADGISAVHVTGNLVRIDLMTMQPQLKSKDGQPVVEVNQRIIMPLEGFVQSLAVQDNIIKQLIEAGLLKKRLRSLSAKPVWAPPRAVNRAEWVILRKSYTFSPATWLLARWGNIIRNVATINSLIPSNNVKILALLH